VATSFRTYLLNLGYSNTEIIRHLHDTIFDYPIDEANQVSIKYINTPTLESIFESHRKLWNKNSDSVFIAVGAYKTQVINVKQKPIKGKSDRACLESFDYGINTEGYEEADFEKISKAFIDSSFLYEFVSKRKVKSEEVDKDLLLNLLALRSDLGKNPTAHLLILRCLFVKYLEDRGIFKNGYLVERLKDESPRKLIIAFNEIRKINGDVFKYEKLTSSDISIKDLKKLALFFETDYRFGQGTLFPYQFDQIPIQLISHVYEAFLKSESKKGRGIYYTPYFLVDFILKQTLTKLVESNKNCKVLDPAVGSGAFLVESFKIIQKAYGDNVSFEMKKKILETQLFGIDIDKSALQISAFSLYLALLETETPEFIRDKIEHSSPILPSLIGKNLIAGNALLDNKIFEGEIFDCILSNPPWGSASESGDEDERLALSGKNVDFPEYQHVADYEKSQAFLVRIERWADSSTHCAMVVKNSIFLNKGSLLFRQNLLQSSTIEEFYELSHYNRILFKKRVLGKVGKEKIEIGASEPCAVVIFKPIANGGDYNLKYASPKLTAFAEKLNLIHCKTGDVSILKNTDFISNDSLWRILIHGDKEDFELIEKLKLLRVDVSASCSKGFEPSPNYKPSSNSAFRKLVKSEYFEQYFLVRKPTEFPWDENRLDKLRRPFNDEFYFGDRILIANRPKPSDGFRLRAIFTSQKLIFRNDVFCLKLKNEEYTKPYLALINSSLFGYFLFHESVQWFGGEKRDSLRKFELLNLPFIDLDNNRIKTFTKAVSFIESGNPEFLAKIDNLVFDNYSLLDYEKEIIREFYQTRVERADIKLALVTKKDLQQYFEEFKRAFSLILSPDHSISATYQISSSLGAIICISIINKNDSADAIFENSELSLLRFAKSKQLTKVEATKILYEEKVKIYDKNKIYIIKSNQFKDWTVRMAMLDAKEEMGLFLKHLPSKNG
jgi:type I restriction-modification system DNA methylase subunit